MLLDDCGAIIFRNVRLPIPWALGQHVSLDRVAGHCSFLLVKSLEGKYVHSVHNRPTDGATIVRCCH